MTRLGLTTIIMGLLLGMPAAHAKDFHVKGAKITFTNTFFDSIKVYTNGKGTVARNITITGNRITGWHTNPMNPKSAAAINLRNVVGGVIRNNTIGPGAAPAAISQGIRLQNCKDVVQETNKIE